MQYCHFLVKVPNAKLMLRVYRNLCWQCEDSIVSPERHAESVRVSPGPDAQQEHRQGVGKALYSPFLANCGRC